MIFKKIGCGFAKKGKEKESMPFLLTCILAKSY